MTPALYTCWWIHIGRWSVYCVEVQHSGLILLSKSVLSRWSSAASAEEALLPILQLADKLKDWRRAEPSFCRWQHDRFVDAENVDDPGDRNVSAKTRDLLLVQLYLERVLVCQTVSQCVLNVLMFYFSSWFLPLFGMCIWHVFIKLLT